MGNIGEQGPVCIHFDFSKNSGNVYFVCPSGKLNRIDSAGLLANSDPNTTNQCIEINKWSTRYKNFNDDRVNFEEGILDINEEGTRYYDTYVNSSRTCSTYYNDELVQSEFMNDLTI